MIARSVFRSGRRGIRRIRVGICTIPLFFAVSPLSADKPIERAIRQLEAGDPEAARSTLVAMLDRVGPSVETDEANLRALAVALMYRAIAEFELGRPRDARWSWMMATYFHPDLARVDFAPLGTAGTFLSTQKWAEPPADFDPGNPGALVPEGTVPAEKIAAPTPHFGEGPLGRGVRTAARLLARIETDGQLDSVRVFDPRPDPGYAYSILEALRSWRFEPARKGGEAVPIWYWLVFSFDFR